MVLAVLSLGARFGPYGIRSGSRRQRPDRGYSAQLQLNPYKSAVDIVSPVEWTLLTTARLWRCTRYPFRHPYRNQADQSRVHFAPPSSRSLGRCHGEPGYDQGIGWALSPKVDCTRGGSHHRESVRSC
jgi:hypothetical protein